MPAHYTGNNGKQHPGFTELVSQTQVEREIEISHIEILTFLSKIEIDM